MNVDGYKGLKEIQLMNMTEEYEARVNRWFWESKPPRTTTFASKRKSDIIKNFRRWSRRAENVVAMDLQVKYSYMDWSTSSYQIVDYMFPLSREERDYKKALQWRTRCRTRSASTVRI